MRIRRSAKTAKTRAVAYLRVSTSEQHLGPRAQMAAIEAYADRTDVELVAVFLDLGVSGGKEVSDRPGLCAALAHRGVQALVASKRDRLARDVAIAGDIERLAAKEGKRVLSADGANGEEDADAFRRDIEAVLSAHERRVIRKRTRDALAVKKARGEGLGAVAMGFQRTSPGHCAACAAHAAETRSDRGIHVEPNPEEARMVARAVALSEQGLSVRKITEALNAEGYRNRQGRPSIWQGVYAWLRPLVALMAA